MDAWTPYLFFGTVAAVGLANFAWGVVTGMPVSRWLTQRRSKPRPATAPDYE
jgi:hypothetical protein